MSGSIPKPQSRGKSLVRNTSIVTWYLDPSDFPDDEQTVLMLYRDGRVWPGFRDAGEWREVDGALVTDPVRGWALMPNPPGEVPV